VVAHRLSR